MQITMFKLKSIVVVCFAVAILQTPAFAQHLQRSDADIRAMLGRRADVQKQATGIVVGLIEPQGRRVLTYGSLAQGDMRPLNGDTIFEIASITKVFTALVFADMVARGELALEEEVSQLLQADRVKVPSLNGRKITLLDLATHTSGLPLRPPNLASAEGHNKYRGFTVEHMYEALSGYSLSRESGAAFEYSNMGYGLLGHALALRARMSYDELLSARITQPLELADTRFELSSDMRRRLAIGHSSALEPGFEEDLGALDAAGGLRSTANDLLSFLEVVLGYRKSRLSVVMDSMLDVARPTDERSTRQALGWRITTLKGHEIVWINGRSDGYRSFLGFDRRSRIGVVALANAGTDAGVDDIGQHLINAYYPVNLQDPEDRKQIQLSAAVLDRYVGRYRFDDEVVIDLVRDGSILVGKMSDAEGMFALFPETSTSFFMADVDAQIAFETADGNSANALTLHQNGLKFRARRIQ